jgi:trimethylamine--corrinoid protein Co-methyltransferase
MQPPLRPVLKLLTDSLVGEILDEAFEVLERVGVFFEGREAPAILAGAGARFNSATQRVFMPRDIVERALTTAPHAFSMYGVPGDTEFPVSGDTIHFDPGSAALRIFDFGTQAEREATTGDLVAFHRLTQRLDHFHFQSTGLISSDIPQEAADAYRLFLALLFCSKPVVTGTFTVDGFRPMLDMLAAVRGGADALRRKPLAIFDACPSPPLRWSSLTSQSIIDCARAGIPCELVAMPLTGATAPVTLTGALVQHAAENLAGIILSQATAPGAPVVFGGSPAAFDMKSGSPPMGAMETMMIDSAAAQIGKALGVPTHAYVGLSDSKCLDAQAGLETGIGAVLGALSGINVISGGGMIDYETTQSLEKLVLDDEVCALAYRLVRGIEQREKPMALALLEEIQEGADFITHEHTRKWYRLEHSFPSIIDRGNAQQWMAEGKPTIAERASWRVSELLSAPAVPLVSHEVEGELRSVMESYAKKCGFREIPKYTW